MTGKEAATVQVKCCPTVCLEDWKQWLERPVYEYTPVATWTVASSKM